jgi:putative CocE/NonD family hydrolase
MRRRLPLAVVALAAAAALLPASASAHWKPGPERYGSVEQHDVGVKMKDGTILRANVYSPTNPKTGKPAKGPFPVIMVQTPYGKDGAGTASGGNSTEASTEIGPIPYFIKRGYIDVVVDVRGTGDSQGTFSLLDPQIGRDGAQLVDWASKLPHSNGRVGTYGPSYMGIDQLMTADNVGRNSPLKAMFPVVAGNDAYRDIAFQGGMPGAEFDLVIVALFGGLNVGNPPISDRDLADLITVEAQHIGSLLTYNAYQLANIETGGDQAFYGKYWRQRTQRSYLKTIVRNHIPAFMIGGWFDLFQRGAPLNYSGLQNAWAGRPVGAPMKAGQKLTGRYQLVDGPWYHVTAGSTDQFKVYPVELAWFDHFLKGENTGITHTKHPLHLFELGKGQHFHDAKTYPVNNTPVHRLYLDGGHPSGANALSDNDGTLSEQKPAGANGADPIVWTAANNPCARQADQWGAGAVALAFKSGQLPDSPCDADDRGIQSGPGALTYTSAAFKHDETVAGPIDATIYASSTTPDTELEATVEIVSPNGTSLPISSGALLGSFRKLDKQKTWYAKDGSPILPYHPFTQASKKPVPTGGQVTRYDIEVFPTFAEIAKGNRLRVTITTTDVPHLLPLPTDVANLLGGVYQVQRSNSHASFVSVPIAKNGAFVPCGYVCSFAN